MNMQSGNGMNCKEIYVTRPSMPPYKEYVEAIKPLWKSGLITNMGIYHAELERQLKKYLEVPAVSLMVNGHMSLEMAIQMMGFPEGAEVITTPFTFVSTTHAIVRNNLKPVFCDVKLCDGTIDETKIESLITDKTVAIVPVHVYGNVCNVDRIHEIAEKYGLKVIYDAAHAFGVKYKGKGIGNFGDASIFSFHATKVYNTVEGGAVTFKNKKYYNKLYNLKNFGIYDEELVEEVGANAKMNELCAIMGICNLKHIHRAICERKKRYVEYKEYLCGVAGIRFFSENSDVERNYGYLPIVVEESCILDRDKIYRVLRENGIFARKYFYPLIPEQLCYQNQYRQDKLKNAKKLSKQILVLPLYEEMEMQMIKKISRIIKSVIIQRYESNQRELE